jgi:hypothetical protein
LQGATEPVALWRYAHFTADNTETPNAPPPTGSFPGYNRNDNTLTKIIRKRSCHPMLASSPASTLNITEPEPESPHSEIS